jgi:hypothetical protein
MNRNLIIWLTIAHSGVTTAAAVTAALDPNDFGADDELAAALRLASERIQAFLIRSQQMENA